MVLVGDDDDDHDDDDDDDGGDDDDDDDDKVFMVFVSYLFFSFYSRSKGRLTGYGLRPV